MKRIFFLCAVSLAACGGKTESAPTPAPSAAPADAELAFRKGYSNPGGMWMPAQMTLPVHADTLHKMGVPLDAKTLADPLGAPLAAVVLLNGCTGSFVSPDGLVVTNHHCVQGALQLNSTAQNNLMETGFLAKTRADEKTAGPAARVRVVQKYTDVTHEMRDGIEQTKDPEARQKELEKRQKALVAACEKDRPGIRCEIESFFGSGMFQLIEMLELRDLRLVYVPPRSVGDYGGEIDNWEWPRHTGDWSFYRAYVGKDGKAADYASDNVPYHPAHHLQVSTAGLKAGDFVMVTGYPGFTNRLTTASEVHHDVEWTYPYAIAYYQAVYALLEAHLKDPGETGIKAGLAKQFIQNALENQEGVLANLKKGDLLAHKEQVDKKVKDWVAQAGHEQEKARLDRLEAIQAEQRRTARVDFDRDNAFASTRLMGTAISLSYWAQERGKPDAERRPGFQDRDMAPALARARELTRKYDRTLDHARLRLALVRALDEPVAERAWLATLLGAKSGQTLDAAFIDKTLDAWYAAQKLESETLRVDLLQHATPQALFALKDPFMQAAQRVWPIVKAEEKKNDAREGELLLVSPAYAEALRQVLGGALSPDANSTLRITYGTVKSLKPESSAPVDWPFTVASQLLAKDTGKEPFNSPASLLAAIKAKQFGAYADPALGGELPIDFLSDLDITGGNSGSPTLNGKGELVGLAFDGNKEGLASDVVFNGGTTRTIHVDARYMIWTMEGLDGARPLLDEMGIKAQLKDEPSHAAAPSEPASGDSVLVRVSGVNGSQVFIDGLEVGRIPLELSFPSKPGQRMVSVRRVGYETFTTAIAADENAIVTARLRAVAAPPKISQGSLKNSSAR